jgi:hypothetical protein
LLKILNRFWTLLKILSRFWTDSDLCWKFWTDSLQILKRFWDWNKENVKFNEK